MWCLNIAVIFHSRKEKSKTTEKKEGKRKTTSKERTREVDNKGVKVRVWSWDGGVSLEIRGQ